VSTPIEAIAAAHRSAQVYYEQITEQTALSAGVAFTCPEYPTLDEGNQFREVILPRDGSLADVHAEVTDFFDRHGLRCYRWVPAAGTPIEPLEAFLLERGYTLHRSQCMVLTRDVDVPASDDVRILPARAMRQALRVLRMADTRYDPAMRAILADSRNERLDDPSYDQVVAMIDKQPAGTGVLMQVGDIGRVENVFVAERFRRRGVARSIMSHLLTLNRRLALRITVLEVDEGNIPALALYRQCGFDPAGPRVEFIAPGV
jgi:ribosomal protein S18 acetylase RimI-like enzyme